MDEQFQIAETERGGSRVVVLRGELDLAVAPGLDRHLRAILEDDQAVELDLSELSFIDSTGLAVLIRTAEAADREGGSFTIGALSESVMRVVELAGLTERLHLSRQVE